MPRRIDVRFVEDGLQQASPFEQRDVEERLPVEPEQVDGDEADRVLGPEGPLVDRSLDALGRLIRPVAPHADERLADEGAHAGDLVGSRPEAAALVHRLLGQEAIDDETVGPRRRIEGIDHPELVIDRLARFVDDHGPRAVDGGEATDADPQRLDDRVADVAGRPGAERLRPQRREHCAGGGVDNGAIGRVCRCGRLGRVGPIGRLGRVRRLHHRQILPGRAIIIGR